jgi:hypothetical protein
MTATPSEPSGNACAVGAAPRSRQIKSRSRSPQCKIAAMHAPTCEISAAPSDPESADHIDHIDHAHRKCK